MTLTDDNAIDIQYEAQTDKETVVNLTNHSYFNLSGDANNTILDHQLMINAMHLLPVDDTFMTTGEIASGGYSHGFQGAHSCGRAHRPI